MSFFQRRDRILRDMVAVSLLVSVANFMLILNLWNVVAGHERVITQEANPNITVERPLTEQELHDQRVRESIEYNRQRREQEQSDATEDL